MKALLLCCIIATVHSKSFVHHVPAHIVPVAPVPAKIEVAPAVVVPQVVESGHSAQFRSEDNLGNYAFGYNEDHTSGGTFRREHGDGHGGVVGSYGLKDADGRVRIVNYVADDNGFRADIKTNEPGVEPKDPADTTINKEAALVAEVPAIPDAHVVAPAVPVVDHAAHVVAPAHVAPVFPPSASVVTKSHAVVQPPVLIPHPAPVVTKSILAAPAPVSKAQVIYTESTIPHAQVVTKSEVPIKVHEPVVVSKSHVAPAVITSYVPSVIEHPVATKSVVHTPIVSAAPVATHAHSYYPYHGWGSQNWYSPYHNWHHGGIWNYGHYPYSAYASPVTAFAGPLSYPFTYGRRRLEA